MIRTSRRLRLCMALIVVNLCFIWGNSLLPGEVSGAISDAVRDALRWVMALLGFPPGGGGGGGLLRKIAHFTEFACLGALFAWLYGMLRKPVGLALVCGVLAACVDETIQCFVPDRGPGIRDVLIDFAGVLTGAALLWLLYLIRKRKQI